MKAGYLLILTIVACSLAANPVYDGLYINEFYWDDAGWQIELISYMTQYTLDGCALSSNSGYTEFLNGLSIYPTLYRVVTQNDMQTWLSINSSEDFITSYDADGYTNACAYGNFSYGVLAPLPGQSLIPVTFCLDPVGMIITRYCKDNSPTLGYYNSGGGSSGTFCGYVYDSQNNPIANIQVEHYPYNYTNAELFTDENGYFEKDLYATVFDISIHVSENDSINIQIQIEPDSLNYYEFIFENYVHSDDYEIELSASFYQLSNHPNPFNPSTTISFSLTTEITEGTESTEIQIFNSKGQKVKTLTFPSRSSGMSEGVVVWNGKDDNGNSVASGVYFYKLVSGDKELAANKMLLLR